MLVPELDIHGALRRPYRRRRKSLWESLNELVENRHAFVHRGDVNVNFDDETLATAILDSQVAVVESIGDCAKSRLGRHLIDDDTVDR